LKFKVDVEDLSLAKIWYLQIIFTPADLNKSPVGHLYCYWSCWFTTSQNQDFRV